MNQFKRAQVIVLPTNEKSLNSVFCIRSDKPYMMSEKDSPFRARIYDTKELYHTYYNLYIISDDEIKEGDWFIGDNISIKQCTLNNGGNINFKGGWYSGSTNCKKIIATTDRSLQINTFYKVTGVFDGGLPQPSQQFIEKYIEEYNNTGNVIKDVLVEYDYYTPGIDDSGYGFATGKEIEKIKVNPKDNTITIKKLKDSWNREEVTEQMWIAYKAANTVFEDESVLRNEFDSWIDQNS